MTRRLLLVPTLLLGGLAAPAAVAQDACVEDVRRLCPDVELGSRRIASCLRANEPRLSAACREKLASDALEARRLVEEFGRACRKDVDDLCPGVEPGGGRVLGCLAQHQLELSTPCQAQIDRFAEARERVAAFRRACTADLESLCKGVPPQAGPLLECLQANEARLSSGCSPAEVRRAAEAVSVVDAIEEMSQQDRLRETLEILQGIDSVAFSRSQVLLQYDSYDEVGGKVDGSRLLFNPQFVFGERRQFSLQVKVPVTTLYPEASGALHGLGDVSTAFAWNLGARAQMRHYLSVGFQLETASHPALGGIWAVQPAYAVAGRLARWVSITAQLAWLRSTGSTGDRPETSLLVLEPILVANLPGRSFLALDTKLGWNLIDGSFVPVMKGVAGLFTDRHKAVSISAWYQASLTDEAVSQSFDYGIGLGLAYYFDW